MPTSALRPAAPPATSTMVAGRVLTTPYAQPSRPMTNPPPTIHQRRRRLRAKVSRSLRRCSSPWASSFQPRSRKASEPGAGAAAPRPEWRGGGDGVGDGVGTERQPAHEAGLPPTCREPLQRQRADQGEPLSGHGCATGIDVKRGPPSRGEDEVPPLDRAFAEQLAEALLRGGILAQH